MTHLPTIRCGPPCRRKHCRPTVSFLPSHRPGSLYYRPSGLCVACYARLVVQWKRDHHRLERLATQAALLPEAGV
jgi:hypothetical protein